jgi:hypothetical protein
MYSGDTRKFTFWLLHSQHRCLLYRVASPVVVQLGVAKRQAKRACPQRRNERAGSRSVIDGSPSRVGLRETNLIRSATNDRGDDEPSRASGKEP